MTPFVSATTRRQSKRRYRRILFAEPLEMRALLSAVPGSVLVDRLESTIWGWAPALKGEAPDTFAVAQSVSARP